MDCVFELKDVVFAYQQKAEPILNGFSLEIERGVRTSILGCNGAGKTTFFNTLTGVNKPQSGEVLFNGNPVEYTKKGLMDLRSNVAVVLQNPDEQIFCSLVEEDIAFGPLNIGLDREEVERRVDRALKDVRLIGLNRRPLQQLSGGQRKRVAIAGALAMQPDILIMDEPTAGLDPQAAVEVMELAEKMSLRGVTVLISTHDIDLAYKWAETTNVFRNGAVAFRGNGDEFYSDIDNVYSCGLLAPSIFTMNKDVSAIKGMDPAPYPHNMCEITAKFGGSKKSGKLYLVPAEVENVVSKYEEIVKDAKDCTVGIYGSEVRFELQDKDIEFMFEGLDYCFTQAVKGKDTILIYDSIYAPTIQRQIDRLKEFGFDADTEVVG